MSLARACHSPGDEMVGKSRGVSRVLIAAASSLEAAAGCAFEQFWPTEQAIRSRTNQLVKQFFLSGIVAIEYQPTDNARKFYWPRRIFGRDAFHSVPVFRHLEIRDAVESVPTTAANDSCLRPRLSRRQFELRSAVVRS